MASSRSIRTHLRAAIALARRLETIASPKAQGDPAAYVGYAALIRQRRLAASVLRLGDANAYEARVLIRSMIEIHFNTEWILLHGGQRRASRFVRFSPVEDFTVFERVAPALCWPDAPAIRKRIIRARAEVRRMFRVKDRTGHLKWARTWATVSSFESRLRQVLHRHRAGDSLDSDFFYGLYIWFSSTVHGGPRSFRSVVHYVGRQPQPVEQPEPDPRAQMAGALAVLQAHITALARLTGLTRMLEPSLSTLTRDVKALSKARGPLWAGRAPG